MLHARCRTAKHDNEVVFCFLARNLFITGFQSLGINIMMYVCLAVCLFVRQLDSLFMCRRLHH